MPSIDRLSRPAERAGACRDQAFKEVCTVGLSVSALTVGRPVLIRELTKLWRSPIQLSAPRPSEYQDAEAEQ